MENNNEKISIGQCSNCGTELKGTYCHECGQKVSNSTHGIKDFLLEYLNNAYMWDPQIFTTLWQLASKPGYLSKRFLSGKFISHAHPLKINMFLLFVFITFFVMFNQTESMNKSYYNYTRDEMVFGLVQMQFLFDNEELVEKLKSGPKDTVRMRAPLVLEQEYPEIVTVLEIEEDNKGESVDKWIGIIPQVLIENKILLCDEYGYYYLNPDTKVYSDSGGLNILDDVVSAMLDIINNYFPLIILFTVPLLSFSVRLVQYRHKIPQLNHFVFSLHYTAFLELMILLIYFAYLIIGYSIPVFKWFFVIISNIYLIVAFREVYNVKSWGKAVLKSLFTSTIYLMICGLILFGIFLAACVIVAINH